MTSILVTGGAGYLGSVLIGRLLHHGFNVTVLDNFRHGLPTLSGYCDHQRNFRIVRGDARSEGVLSTLCPKAEVIVALAAIVGAPACDESIPDTISTNQEAIEKLIDQCPRPKLIIFPNTNSGYGIGGSGLCDEASPLQPVSLYGRTKVKAEQSVLEANGISLRFATLFGSSPRMRTDLMVNDFVLRALREGSLSIFEPAARRNFLHVQDAASAIIHCIYRAEAMRGRAYNAGNSNLNMTKMSLAERIAAKVEAFTQRPVALTTIEGKDPDKRDYLVSNARLEATGWWAPTGLDEGIDELIQCYQQPFIGPYRNA